MSNIQIASKTLTVQKKYKKLSNFLNVQSFSAHFKSKVFEHKDKLLNYTLLNSQEATEEIREEIKRYLESGNEKNPDWKRSKTLTADDMILYR